MYPNTQRFTIKSKLVFLPFLLIAGLLTACGSLGTNPDVTIEISEDGFNAPETIPSGIMPLTIKNTGQTPRSPMFARLNDGVTMEDFAAAFSISPEAPLALVQLLGGQMIQPGESLQVSFNLKEGTHVAIAFAGNPPAEGEQPSVAAFQVVPNGNRSQDEPAANIDLTLFDFAFDLPDEIPSGIQTWKIENMGNQWHEMLIVKMASGVTEEDLMAQMGDPSAEGPPPYEEVAFWAPMNQGEKAWTTFDLAPGTYKVLCLLPDFASEMSHLDHGMVKTLTVTAQ